MRGWPPWALEDEMLTIRPHCSSIMSGTTAWQQSKVPVRLTAKMRFHFSEVIERKGSKPSRPALFTRMVGRPRRSRTSTTAASICARSVTSTVSPIALPPDATIFSAAARADAPSRSKMASACPSAASRSLMASPIPDPPPVTIATRTSVIGSAPRRATSCGACREVSWRRTGRPGAAHLGCPR